MVLNFDIDVTVYWIYELESESEVAQSCLTLCDPMYCSLPGSSVHGIFQARILEWVPISFSRRSSQHRGWTRVSRIIGRCFTIWATREAQVCIYPLPISTQKELSERQSDKQEVDVFREKQTPQTECGPSRKATDPERLVSFYGLGNFID